MYMRLAQQTGSRMASCLCLCRHTLSVHPRERDGSRRNARLVGNLLDQLRIRAGYLRVGQGMLVGLDRHSGLPMLR